jgi:hypothetical protein
MPIAAYWPAPPVFFERPACTQVGGVVDYWGFFAQPKMLPTEDLPSISSKRKRHNISDACAACRRSKVKCDELKPCRRCLRDGRRIACVSWRDGKAPASASSSPVGVLPGVPDMQALATAFVAASQQFNATEEQPKVAVKKPRISKPAARAQPTSSAVMESATVVKEEPAKANGVSVECAVKNNAWESQDSLKEASDLLLSFARECRKDLPQQC